MEAGRFHAYLRDRLPIHPVASLPEVRLHQAGPRSGLRRWAERAGHAGPPYWAHPWSGGVALARLLLDEPDRVAGQSVLDLGTGSGLVAIAAALAGAARVRAVDTDPYAVMAACRNAELNGVSIAVESADLLDGPPPAEAVVLAGDLFYASRLARRAHAFLRGCHAAGRCILIGDPGRAHLPLQALEPLRSRPTPDFASGDVHPTGTVYALRGEGRTPESVNAP